MPASRDPVAFSRIVEAHERAVLAYALRRTRTPADAEDVAAETWAIAWRRRDTLPDDPLPWLFATARRVLANQRRGGRRRLALLDRLRGRAEAATGDALAGPVGLDPIVATALSRLRPDDAELLRLVAWEDLEHARIAATLGVSVNAVAIRLHRARARFAAVYRELQQGSPEDGAGVPADLAPAPLKGPGADRTHGSMKAALAPRAQEVDG